MPFAEIRGRRVHFQDTGGDGPPITFSHDHLADQTAFAPQVADLADVYRAITWICPGDRSGAMDSRSLSYPGLAGDLFALLDVLGIERAVLVGAGQGAAVSLRAALLHPDRVRALVLVDAFLPPSKQDPRLEADDVTDQVGEIASPVLLVHGADDPALPRGHAEKVAASVADCRGIIEVAGAGAGSYRSHPQVVTPAIREFLEGLPA